MNIPDTLPDCLHTRFAVALASEKSAHSWHAGHWHTERNCAMMHRVTLSTVPSGKHRLVAWCVSGMAWRVHGSQRSACSSTLKCKPLGSLLPSSTDTYSFHMTPFARRAIVLTVLMLDASVPSAALTPTERVADDVAQFELDTPSSCGGSATGKWLKGASTTWSRRLF